MSKAKYLIDRMRELDDDSFIEIAEAITDRSAETEVKKNDDLVHLSEIEDPSIDWISTGYTTLDDKIRGLAGGHVVLIGGETSNGKSALATNIAVNISRQMPVLYITLEMLHHELKKRIELCNDGTVDGLDMIFQKDFRITYKDVEPIIMKAKAMGEIKVVVLDYLQYLGRGMTLDEVARMSKEIKSLALKYQVPMIVIVSLRKSEAGKNKRKWTEIEIEDLMGTASIGYDCDTAVVVSRKDLDNEFDPEHVFIKVLKTRNTKLDYHDRYIQLEWKETKIIEDWTVPTSKTANMKEV